MNETDAVMVVEDPMNQSQSLRVVESTLKAKLPAAFGLSSLVAAGGFVSYGPNRAELWRRALGLTIPPSLLLRADQVIE